MKKLLFLMAVFTIALLSSCRSDGGVVPTSGAVTNESAPDVDAIRIWAWDPNFNLAALEIANDFFHAIHPDVEVIIEENSQADITQQMNIAFAAGTMVGMPNIVLIENYRAQIFLQPFNDLFYPLDNYINPDDFTQYLIPATSYGGVQFGVPFDTGSMGWFVRTDILDQAGFTTDDLWEIDWREAIEIGEQVLEQTGIAMFSHDLSSINGFVRANMMASGIWYTEEDGNTININNNIHITRAFELFRDMVETGLIINHSDWAGYLANFNNGNVWSVPQAVWITPSITLASEQSGNWAVVPYPSMPGVPNPGNASSHGGSSWYVLNIPGKEVSAEYLAVSFGGSVEFHERLITEVGALSVFVPFFDSPVLQEGVGFFGGQPIFQYFTQWANQIPRFQPGIHTYLVNDILNVAGVEVLQEGRDIQDALDAAQHHADTQIIN